MDYLIEQLGKGFPSEHLTENMFQNHNAKFLREELEGENEGTERMGVGRAPLMGQHGLNSPLTSGIIHI